MIIRLQTYKYYLYIANGWDVFNIFLLSDRRAAICQHVRDL